MESGLFQPLGSPRRKTFYLSSPNAVVEPIHPKAMPVILTIDGHLQRCFPCALSHVGDLEKQRDY
jgi:hypothetical protein